MPPKTRGTKTTKASKENIGVIEKNKLKGVTKVSKPRKALADKTNSASDDNASTEILTKVSKKVTTKVVENEDKIDRLINKPRRERRLPNRFVDNQVLQSLSNSNDVEPEHVKSKTSIKNSSPLSSPFKTPEKGADNSLIANRPKRVCRLPSRFDDHSVSPNRFIPVGCHASTPILPTKAKSVIKANDVGTKANPEIKTNEKLTSRKVAKQPKVINKNTPEKIKVKKPNKNNLEKSPQKVKNSPVKKPIIAKSATLASSDTNNNAKKRTLRANVAKNKPHSPEKQSPVKTAGQKLLEKSFSFRVLEDKKQLLKRNSSHLDVYEFTYDPNEEPPPQKKKKKRPVKKKPAKPKPVVFKNNYDQNLNKALAALKNVVSKKTQPAVTENVQNKPKNVPQIIVNNTPKPNNTVQDLEQHKNHVSIGIEDIAADIEPIDHHEMNYSPVNSPNVVRSPRPSSRRHSIDRRYQDPLNLQDCLSFFDEQPVASSSMNVSTRKPQETPWRVEFEQLPIKWQVNTYVKPNMTPAVESSFINFDDSKKKHVYTNMVPETNDDLPEIVESAQPNLKQTSIISYIREVVQRSNSKKKRARSVTPTKANSLFEDISNISVQTNKDGYRTPRKTPRKVPLNSTPNQNEVNNDINNENNDDDKENSGESSKSKSGSAKKSNQKKDKDGTFFGFDESEDQENVSHVKIDNPRVRALRPRARAVLHEINAQTGPSRAKLPLAAKTNIVASSEAVNKVYDDMKSATDAPVFPEKNVDDVAATEVEEHFEGNESDDSQSVHLFEDVEVVHHMQPSRKSYGKAAKKVTFQGSSSDSESQIAVARDLDSDDDLADLTFTLPNMQEKSKPKKKPKKKDNLSKKEKAELDAWAAGFNSMCEDIEEFPLVVE